MGWRRAWMLAGFASALVGDWLLAVKGSPKGGAGFLGGVIAFTGAHWCWMTAQLREAKPIPRAVAALGIPLVVLAGLRLAPLVPKFTAVALCVYALTTALGMATALATRRRWYVWGIWLLALSDVFIGQRMLGAPACGALVGPVYVTAELCLLGSCFLKNERRLDWQAGNPHGRALLGGAVGVFFFLLGMATFPGGGYNPCMRMLSALGRVVVRGVDWPFCHFAFTIGMAVASIAVARAGVRLRDQLPTGWRRQAFGWGLAVNVAGLLTIAAAPEDVNGFFHNTGCWLAAGGGAVALFARDRKGGDRVWTVLLAGIAAVFGLVNAVHAAKLLSFAPWVPTLQKVLIVAFMAWIVALTRPLADDRARRFGRWLAALLLVAVSLLVWKEWPVPEPEAAVVASDSGSAGHTYVAGLTEDEHAALRWIEYVTGPLDAAAEKEWWGIGGRQFGLFSRRYHIAFAGYAAATLGLRGDAEVRRTVGRILDRCLVRYLDRETWKYSMSKSYWGRKPWAPDPCFRENVMYTGHLLQLLALYEYYTGDQKYWKQGFDFVWGARKVHYTVQKLIDVTVHQMRHGPNGGIACEPGLVFFPCNNHPHFALRLFSKLGHGDWSREDRRWEHWALTHYRDPIFGGGALNLVYHQRSGLLYPYGHPGLDGWSMLWYEPWANRRGVALTLWREAASRIDWSRFEPPSDTVRGQMTCSDPSDVPYTISAAFLLAAARVCDDNVTAERLERALDRHLRRDNGHFWLDLGREWRICATANRIIAMAVKHGSRWRPILAPGPIRAPLAQKPRN